MWWAAAGMLAQSVYHFLRSMKEHAFTGAALRAALHEAGVSTRGFSAVGGPREVLVSMALPAPGLLAPWGCAVERTPYWCFSDDRAPLDMEVLCTPHSRSAPLRGVLLHFTSWSWAVSSRRVGSRALAMQAATAGWVVMLPRPRTVPSVVWPQPLTDAKRALAWCKLHCGLWGGDPHRVVASGDSTGAHVALMLGLTPNAPALQRGVQGVDTSVAAMVAIHPVVDLADSGDSMSQRDPSRSGFQLLQLLLRRRYARDRMPFVAASPLHQVLGPEHLWREQQRSRQAADAASLSAGAASRANLHAAVHQDVLPGALDGHAPEGGAGGVASRTVSAAQRFVMRYVFGVPVHSRVPQPLGSHTNSSLLQAGADKNAAAVGSWGAGRAPVVPPLHTVMGGVPAPGSLPYVSSIMQPTAVHRGRDGGYSSQAKAPQRGRGGCEGEEGGPGGGGLDHAELRVQVPQVVAAPTADRRGPMRGSVPAGGRSHGATPPHRRGEGVSAGTASGKLAMLEGARAASEAAAPPAGSLLRTRVPPCLLVHGSNDCVVPPEEALRFWHALRLRRVAEGGGDPPLDCLMLLPGGGHFFSCIPSHRTLASGRGILHWAGAVAGGSGSAPSGTQVTAAAATAATATAAAAASEAKL